MFDTGPQFVFNLGGGPGFRVHQFGGARPRRRPRDDGSGGGGGGGGGNHATNGGGDDDTTPPPSLLSILSNLLPLIILFVLPLLSSLASLSSSSSDGDVGGPSVRFDEPAPPLTLRRTTPRLGVHYFVNPADVAEWPARRLAQLDQRAEVALLGRLRAGCDDEQARQRQLMAAAQGWFRHDAAQLRAARRMPMPNCERLDQLRSGRSWF